MNGTDKQGQIYDLLDKLAQLRLVLKSAQKDRAAMEAMCNVTVMKINNIRRALLLAGHRGND